METLISTSLEKIVGNLVNCHHNPLSGKCSHKQRENSVELMPESKIQVSGQHQKLRWVPVILQRRYDAPTSNAGMMHPPLLTEVALEL